MEKNKNLITWGVIAVLVIVLALVVSGNAGKGSPEATLPPADTTQTPITEQPIIPGPVVTTPVAPASTLDGHTYRLTGYDSTAVLTGENYFVSFAGGRMQVKICNTFSGPYSAKSGTLSATLVSTQLACVRPVDANNIEKLFGSTLAQPANYVQTANSLVLTGAGHSFFLALTK